MEAVILAGGKGTRLQSVIKDIPKPMADINGKPFLEHLINFLSQKNITKFIISAGYKYKIIQDYFKNSYNHCAVEYAIEDEPLGTGGGIKKSLALCQNSCAIVLNGDTFFDVDISNLYQKHIQSGAELTVALRKVNDTSRYGTVCYDKQNNITGFSEKSNQGGEGYINGGVYVINTNIFDHLNLGDRFSFEKDFLEIFFKSIKMKVFLSEAYFIDIGIPEEYEKAKIDFKGFNN